MKKIISQIIKDENKPKKISEKIVLENGFRKIISKDFVDKNGKKSNFLIASHYGKVNSAVVILAITKTNKILYIEEFRYGPEETLIQFPMGGVEKNDGLKFTVEKELKEETGYYSEEISFLFELIVSNYEDTKIFNYVAKNCEIGEQNLESTEFIEIKKTSKNNFEKMILDGKVKCPLTISLFYFAKAKEII